MLLSFVAYTLVAAIAPQLVPGVRVRSLGTAAVVAILFGLLNLLVGWLVGFLVTLFALPLVVLTVGLFAFVIPTLINAILLSAVAALMEDFELRGFGAALWLGLLFALTGWLLG